MCAKSAALSRTPSATNASAASEVFGIRMRRARRTGKMTPESARAGHGVKQAMQMPGDGVKPRAVGDFARDIRRQRRRGLLRSRKRRRFAEHQWIDGQKPPRLLIGGTPHHHAVDMVQMRACLLDAADAAIENDRSVPDARV